MSGRAVGEGSSRVADVGSTEPAIRQDVAQPPRRRSRAIPLIVVLALAAGLLVFGVDLSLRPKGPPAVPARLRAVADLCLPSRCDGFRPTVELTWEAPTTGDPVTGTSILRDGEPLLHGRLAPTETTFVDDSVVMGQRYEYAVVAHSASGSSPRSVGVRVELPEPPLHLAQLDGTFRIRYAVQRARNLGSLFGIRNPRQGDRISLEQRVSSMCAADEGACPTRWVFGAEPLGPDGLMYRGRFVDHVKARCFGGDRVPVRVSIRLEIREAKVSEAAWLVTAFSGTHTIAFRCPGALVSIGTLSMHARA